MRDTTDYAAMCATKQRHDTRAAARIEATNKTQLTGRRHDVYGCPLCEGFHARADLRPARKQARAKRRADRYAPVGE